MGYFDDEKNVEEYIQMAEGFDGRQLIEVLKAHQPIGSNVLELGMGPGVDLDILSESFLATGSDASKVFVDRYRKMHPDADLLVLDAITLDTGRKFDGIYSNKVLHHLTKEQLKESFQRQAEVVNPHAILLHSFWHGDKEEEHAGERFVYYTEDALREFIGSEYKIEELVRYTEIEENDSLYIVLKTS